eukprot:TRINITY_DN122096_c0_g1_i1.p2 TRINITY_DN122096_c0_g1~~TRINITY_DN122096_c0_g1_i1.p2  ORF type:complete len:107 (-),score=6.90 TRINITY_DN122096_c0_g1_i1:133-453(-)
MAVWKTLHQVALPLFVVCIVAMFAIKHTTVHKHWLHICVLNAEFHQSLEHMLLPIYAVSVVDMLIPTVLAFCNTCNSLSKGPTLARVSAKFFCMASRRSRRTRYRL